MVPTPYTFCKLMSHLKESPEGHKLALLAAQIKTERPLLAQIMHEGNVKFPKLDFYLDEKKRDLTVRIRPKDVDAKPGRLVDWIEAKMTYTDSLARRITKHANRDEYRILLDEDAKKQRRERAALSEADRKTHLTSLLFAVHHKKPVWRHKYYPNFRNRRGLAAHKIETEALRYVRDLSRKIGRKIVEKFMIPLDGNCRLHVFVLRDSV